MILMLGALASNELCRLTGSGSCKYGYYEGFRNLWFHSWLSMRRDDGLIDGVVAAWLAVFLNDGGPFPCTWDDRWSEQNNFFGYKEYYRQGPQVPPPQALCTFWTRDLAWLICIYHTSLAVLLHIPHPISMTAHSLGASYPHPPIKNQKNLITMMYNSPNVNYKPFLLHMFLDPSLRCVHAQYPTPIGQHRYYSLVNTRGPQRTRNDLN